MSVDAEIAELLEDAAKARQATITAQMKWEDAGRRYREAMAAQAVATKALSDARCALGRGKPLNV